MYSIFLITYVDKLHSCIFNFAQKEIQSGFFNIIQKMRCRVSTYLRCLLHGLVHSTSFHFVLSFELFIFFAYCLGYCKNKKSSKIFILFTKNVRQKINNFLINFITIISTLLLYTERRSPNKKSKTLNTNFEGKPLL